MKSYYLVLLTVNYGNYNNNLFYVAPLSNNSLLEALILANAQGKNDLKRLDIRQ